MSGGARRVAAEVGHFVRAHVASGIASGLEWLLVTGLVLAGVHYLVAAAAGAVTGAATDFSLKRYWAFGRTHREGFGREGLRYVAVSLASLALNLAVAYVLVDWLAVRPIPGVIGASILVGFGWNYPLHRIYVFRSEAPPAAAGASRCAP